MNKTEKIENRKEKCEVFVSIQIRLHDEKLSYSEKGNELQDTILRPKHEGPDGPNEISNT
jgi:hypothetical protein